ncbi:MAG: hypothetical protein ACOVP4_11420 [Bacteriovoracaceae bacterium]
MKSCFLLLALGAILFQSAYAQAPITAVKQANDDKSTFDQFYDKLKIGYFGVLTSSNLENWDQSRASISPEWDLGSEGEDKNSDTWPVNLWNQIAFRYNFGAKMDFVVAPRWVTMLGSTKRMAEPEDNSFLMLDDVLVGFQGVILSLADGKFNWWIRPAVRLPTSRINRTNTNGGFGTISNQIETLSVLSYDFNPTWQLGAFAQTRMWVYEQRYNTSRMRYYLSPYISYSINDKTKIQAFYEVILENNRRWESINGKKPVYKDYWQNIMLAVGHQVTPKLNIMPYIATYVNDIPLSMRSAWFGAWISYAIK